VLSVISNADDGKGKKILWVNPWSGDIFHKIVLSSLLLLYVLFLPLSHFGRSILTLQDLPAMLDRRTTPCPVMLSTRWQLCRLRHEAQRAVETLKEFTAIAGESGHCRHFPVRKDYCSKI
jgi:hypothetical protein